MRRRDLNDRLQDAVVNIGPLSRATPEGKVSEPEQIVRFPAKAVGLDCEDGLVPRVRTRLRLSADGRILAFSDYETCG